ncbi:MAG: nucleotidyltransferase domain-containing protein [Nitrososphaeria archaeon]
MEEKIEYAFLKVFRDQTISIVLYCSYAEAEPKPYSDIDLLIVVRMLPEDRMKPHTLLEC